MPLSWEQSELVIWRLRTQQYCIFHVHLAIAVFSYRRLVGHHGDPHDPRLINERFFPNQPDYLLVFAPCTAIPVFDLSVMDVS